MSETMNIEYTLQIWKENDQFIAHAMPLDFASPGRREVIGHTPKQGLPDRL
ncbi:MAG: hypothetical protein ABIH23_33215 [bacterium]